MDEFEYKSNVKLLIKSKSLPLSRYHAVFQDEFEKRILELKKPKICYHYALYIIKDRWPEAEDIIKTDAWIVYLYARNVIKSRWPEAESILKTNDYYWAGYRNLYRIKFDFNN